jgi:hypothetical protein
MWSNGFTGCDDSGGNLDDLEFFQVRAGHLDGVVD